MTSKNSSKKTTKKPIKESLATLEEHFIDAKNAGDVKQMKIIRVMINRIKTIK